MRPKAFAFALAAALCAPNAAPGASGPRSVKVVRVGVIADVTGPAGAYGSSQKYALDLANDDVRAGRIDAGGVALTFDVRDSASVASQAAGLARTFVKEGVPLLMGPTLSGEARSADAIAAQANVTVLAPSGLAPNLTALGPCVFRSAITEEQIVPQTVDRAVAMWHFKTAAIVYARDDRFSQRDFALFKWALDRQHVALVDVESYRTGDTTFKSQVANIAAKRPDVLVLASRLQDGAAFAVQARRAGLASRLIGGSGLYSPKLIDLAGDAADGLVVGAPYFRENGYEGNPEFVDRYTHRFGLMPDAFAAQAYATAEIVALAVRGGATTSRDFCNAFKNAGSMLTVMGPVNFLPSREIHARAAILHVAGGAFTFLR